MHPNNLRESLDCVKDFLCTIGSNVHKMHLLLNRLEQQRVLYFNLLKFGCVKFLLNSLSEMVPAMHPVI